MKYLLMLIMFIAGFATVNAQTSGGTTTSAQRKIPPPKKATARQLRGSGQYHGSRDTTPGSPMGTGGAGGDMSGSPAASAIETKDQTSKAQVQKDNSGSSQTTVTKKVTTKKKRAVRSNAMSNP